MNLPKGLGLGGWLRIIFRVTAMGLWLLISIAGSVTFRAIRVQDLWPRLCLGGLARLAGVRRKVRGDASSGKTVLLANHVSWIDIAVVAGETGSIFVAHDGLGGVPLVRWLCALNNTVLVARHDPASVARQVEQVRGAIASHHYLTIFPEGTTGDGAHMLPFKSSLLSALDPVPEGVTVQPVLLDYGTDAGRIAWIGTEHGVDNFLRIVARKEPVRVLLHFLPRLEGAALANRKTMAAAAKAALEAARLSG